MSVETRELEVVCDGNRLDAGLSLPPDPRAWVVLLHGIPSVSPSDPNDPGYPGLARRFAEAGYAGAWADLRGVRSSEGFFSIEGWIRDVLAVLESVRGVDGLRDLPGVLVGSSAGGAVSTEAVRRGAPVSYLALLAAPATWVSYATDARSAADRITREAGMPLDPAVVADPEAWAGEFERAETERSISGVTIPVLVVHGSADDVVPVEHAHRIAANARDVEVSILEGAPHQLRKEPRAISAVFGWLEAHGV